MAFALSSAGQAGSIPLDGPPTGVEVRLLGAFRLTVDSVETQLPGGAQRLVALLAVHGRHTRSRAAGTLWPEASETRALGCLRTAIWRCQRLAPGLVRAGGSAVALDAGVELDCAVMAAAARAAMVDPNDDSWPAGIDADLLPDWDEDWLSDERERLRQLRLHLLEAEADRLTTAGRFGLALDAAMRALRADPLRESAHRAVIRIHLAEGNPAQARGALDRCIDVLERELGVRPSPGTSGLLRPRNRDAIVTAR